MKILVGSTELNVNSCAPFRSDNGKIELKVNIPAEGHTEADLRALFKNNTEDILRFADDGVTVVETLSGFHFTVNTGYNEKTDTFTIYAEGVSEAEFQNGRLRQQIAEQNAVIADLGEVIASQNETISAQADSLALMEEIMLEDILTETEEPAADAAESEGE